jgi:rfaE bifunctional protein nucleotidyltransferase chain/domain/rfaE bifunctional protein kinase chain/domain
VSLVVVGDALLDRDLDGYAERLAPDAPVPVVEGAVDHPRPGGAALAAALAAATGERVTLVCGLGDDAAGRALGELLAGAGVEVRDLGLRGATPEKLRVRAGGRVLVRLDSGGDGGAVGPLTGAADHALRRASAVLVSDYGRGVAAEPAVRAALAALAAPVVWDPHPNGPEPVAGVVLATPNEREALAATAAHGSWVGGAPSPRGSLAAVEAAARALARRWGAVHLCVTRGARGALLVGGDGPALAVPAPRVPSGDPCGAGDSFAAAAALRLAAGALPSEAVRAAVDAASSFVAAGGASGAAAAGFAAPAPAPATAAELAERVRSRGGTVVATGGCFDLLHAGHVRMLESARALGDCLIVCLNSDASVRRLKGPDRPLVAQGDRAAVLQGLGCVDAVALFEEDDPRAVLRDIRPNVWAKGGDYAVADLPEAEILAGWGGRPVIVPYVSGRSTSRLIEVARAR